MASEWVVWREAEREKAGQGDSGYIGGGFKCPAKEFHPPIHSFIQEELSTYYVQVQSWCWGDSSQPWEALGTWQVFE